MLPIINYVFVPIEGRTEFPMAFKESVKLCIKRIHIKKTGVLLILLVLFLGSTIAITYNEYTFINNVNNSNKKPAGNLTLKANRYTFYYPLELASKNMNPLIYGYYVQKIKLYLYLNTSFSYNISGTIEYSHDNATWYILKDIIVLAGKTKQMFIVDVNDSWAQVGENFIRLKMGSETTNTIYIYTKTGMWLHAILFYINIILLLIGCWVLLMHLAKKPFKKVILLSLMIRIALAPLTEHRFDMYEYRITGMLILAGKHVFYPLLDKPDFWFYFKWLYTPLFAYYVTLIVMIFVYFGFISIPQDLSQLWQYGVITNNFYDSYRSFIPPSLPVMDLLFKLPLILSDIAMGILLVRKFNIKEETVARYWLMNPYVIFISSVWGMFDPLPTLCVLLAVALFTERKVFLSGLILAIGFGIKIFPGLMFPILFLILIKNAIKMPQRESFAVVVKFLGGFLVGAAFSLVYLLTYPNPIEALDYVFFSRAIPSWKGGVYAQGYSWQNILLTLIKYLNPESSITLPPIFLILFVPLYFVALYMAWQTDLKREKLVELYIFVIFSALLSYNVLNTQYIYWFLPAMLILIDKDFSRKNYNRIWILILGACLSIHNVLYFISPMIIPDEWNETLIVSSEKLKILTLGSALSFVFSSYINYIFVKNILKKLFLLKRNDRIGDRNVKKAQK